MGVAKRKIEPLSSTPVSDWVIPSHMKTIKLFYLQEETGKKMQKITRWRTSSVQSARWQIWILACSLNGQARSVIRNFDAGQILERDHSEDREGEREREECNI